MDTNINTYFTYYWIFCIIFETIYCYYRFNSEWKKIKQDIHSNMFILAVIKTLKDNGYYEKIFNPINYVLFFLIHCMISPILFIFTIKAIINDLISKPKLEVGAEQVSESIDESDKQN